MENPFGYGSLLFFSIYWSILIRICTTLDTITPTQSLRDGDTLVSPGHTYELGFFSLAVPNRRYLGLWYKNIYPRTYVWVANRETPLSNTLGTLNLTTQGNLVLINLTNHIFWSSNTSRSGKLPVAQLLDTGNFIVRDPNKSNSDKILWQSFDFPSNTLLPGMKLGANFETGLNRFLSSWKSSEDPAKNEFSLQIDVRGYPQLVLKKGTNMQYRAGSWNGQRFSGANMLRHNPFFTSEFVLSKNEVYYKYELKNNSVFTRFMINPTGLPQIFTWNYDTNDWMTTNTASIDQCDNYALCGAFARCDTDNSSPCSCLDGFIPKSESYQTSGCSRRIPLNCSVTDRFMKLKGIKLPDTSTSWFNRTIGLAECRRLCLSICSCTAYANLDITGSGSGCLHWLSDLIDIRGLPWGGQDLYVRLSSSELGGPASNNLKAGIITGSVISSVTIMLLVFYIWRRKARQYAMSKNSKEGNGNKEDMDLPLFNLITISEATNDFSSSNKLGEGGFGAVYKGTLVDGQEIAVKRLSKSSGQGLNEFKNEVLIIAKLQHRNLVKLLGCCIHEDEKMLIYEYMPNRSLDFFIFDQIRSKFVDWHMRINIIDGIARGLVYLHQDSRLKIIHRDLKTSNILLDGNMNPKISDFGLARTFGVDQSEANTRRVVGTYGYMSPEYAVDGHFSVKSDVFSFGVLVLEIISGKKNRGFCHAEHGLNLLGHAYTLWIKGMPLELIDECLKDSYNPSVVIRCINMALLCVQQRPEDRPNMSTVVVMLSSENPLPQPKEPGFFLQRNAPESDTSSSKHQSCSANEVSISLLEPR